MKKIFLLIICAALMPWLCAAAEALPEYIYGEGCYVAYDPTGGSTESVPDDSDSRRSFEKGLAVRFDGGEEHVISYGIFPGERVSFPKIGDLPEGERPRIQPPGNSRPPTNILYIRCYIDGEPYDARIAFDEDGNCFLISCDRRPKPAAVTIPVFPVKLNGQLVEPDAGEYPILTYRDVVYIPLEDGYCRFLGLNSDCSSYLNRLTAAVTNGEIAAYTLEFAPAVSNNGGELTAEIINYDVYISSQDPVENQELNWPLITLRGMTYMPLTWDVCQTLDWELSFDPKAGLALSTVDAFRPSWSSPQSHGMLGAQFSVEKYVIGEDCYAGYFIAGMNTDGSDKRLIWRRRGQPEKRFGAECLAELGRYVRLGYALDSYNTERPSDIVPWLDGSVLNITVTVTVVDDKKTYLAKIDMENEKLLGYEELPPMDADN